MEYSPDEYQNLLMCEFVDDLASVFPLSELPVSYTHLVGPDTRAALIRLQTTTFVIGNQFQPLHGGVKLLKTRQRGSNSQHGPDKAAFND